MTTMNDLRVFGGLAVVTITGFESEDDGTGPVDLPGSANWLCEGYGMAGDDLDGPGILWTDYARHGWTFAVLIDADEAEALATFAREAGYAVDQVEPIAGPTNFGDGAGTVEVLKHRDGWVLLAN
jgi:hypothetical protein